MSDTSAMTIPTPQISEPQATIALVRDLIGRDPGKLGATEREHLTEGVHRLCALALSAASAVRREQAGEQGWPPEVVTRVARAMAEHAGFAWEACAQSQWESDARAGLVVLGAPQSKGEAG